MALRCGQDVLKDGDPIRMRSPRNGTRKQHLGERQLHAVMYHYVRGLCDSDFPGLKGMTTDAFCRQLVLLQERWEMATLESALAFLRGDFTPSRDLCILTFDDGLRDHYSYVLPILEEEKIQGLFFLVTGCLEDHRVAAVHKNHFLMARLDFDTYRRKFFEALADQAGQIATDVDFAEVRRTYRWDQREVAIFKYLLNFGLPADLRDGVLDSLFAEQFGEEGEFARGLYLSWHEAMEMQMAGMVIGGHSHDHIALGKLGDEAQRRDLQRCRELLWSRLGPQELWPFSYPYGKANSFTRSTIQHLRDVDFCCAFSTEFGKNTVGQDLFWICRIDPKDVGE